MRSAVGDSVHRLLAVLATLFSVLVLLVAPAQVAQADPLDCAAVAARVEAHNQTAATHNANPPDSSNEAAVAAYNAEAERGNAEIPELESLAAQCRQQGVDVPQVGAAPTPDAPEACPTSLIIPVAYDGRPQGIASCVPATPSPAPAAVPAPPTPAPGTGAPGSRATPKPQAALSDLLQFIPLRPSSLIRNPSIQPGTSYNLATALGARLGSPSANPYSTVTNPRFSTAVSPQPMQAPGLTTPAGTPGMNAPQQEFFATGPQFLDAIKGIPIPTNSTDGQIFLLPDLTGTGIVSDSGPALMVGPGATRAIAGPLDTYGRATGAFGYLDASGAALTDNTGIAAIDIPGATKPYQRGHLWPNRYAAPGDVPQFLAPELGTVNTGGMRVYERYLGEIVRGINGIPPQNVSYLKIPLYIDDKEVPDYYLLQAWGDLGWNLPPTYVQNF